MGMISMLRGDSRSAAEYIWKSELTKSTQETQTGKSEQGVRHCERVDANLCRLLRETGIGKYLNPTEKYLLTASAAVHDIGKSDHKSVKALIKEMPPHVANDHGLIAQRILTKGKFLDSIFENPDHAKVVASIISVHDSGRMDLIESDKKTVRVPRGTDTHPVNLRLLAAIFRLADMLDCSRERAPDLDLSENSTDDDPTNTARRNMSLWEIHEVFKELIYINPETDDSEMLRNVRDEIIRLNSQMTDSHVRVLKEWNLAKDQCKLPYRFTSGSMNCLYTGEDVFPLHPEIGMESSQLEFYLTSSKRYVNPIRLKKYSIAAKISDTGFAADFRMEGTNVDHRPLHYVFHPVAGDTAAESGDLNVEAKVKVQRESGNWSIWRKVDSLVCESSSKTTMILEIPFLEAVKPGREFMIMLGFKWPGTKPLKQSCWWLDDLYSKGKTDVLDLAVRFDGVELSDVSGFCIDIKRCRTVRLDDNEFKKVPGGFSWNSTEHPEHCLAAFNCWTSSL